jgi:hypothetical protein
VTRDEYERRKLQIEAERRAAVELIEAAHQAQLRALELLWLAGGDGAAAALPSPSGSASLEPARLAPAASEPDRRPRYTVGRLWQDIQVALAGLPEEFDTSDLVRALPYSPHRGSLHRNLAELEREGAIEILSRGEGRVTSRYRNLLRQEADGNPA